MVSLKRETFEKEFAWQKQYEDKVIELIRKNAGHFIDIKTASIDRDMKEATDFVINISGGDIAVRLRRNNYKQRDLTIRHKTTWKKGFEPETWKIYNGFGKWYFYGWIDDDNNITEYIIVDLDIVRENMLITPYQGSYIKNKDGTGFIAIKIEELENVGAILVNAII